MAAFGHLVADVLEGVFFPGKSDRGPHHRFDKLSLRSRRLTQGRQDMADCGSYAVVAAESPRKIGDVA